MWLPFQSDNDDSRMFITVKLRNLEHGVNIYHKQVKHHTF